MKKLTPLQNLNPQVFKPVHATDLESQVARYANRGVCSWLRRNEHDPLIEYMKTESSRMMRALCRNPHFRKAVDLGDKVSIKKILNKTCSNGKKTAHARSTAWKVKSRVSWELLVEGGLDPSFRAHNEDVELSGMPKDPFMAIEWVLDDDCVRATSRLEPKLTEKILDLDGLTRQVFLLKHTTKYTAEVIAVILGVSESVVTNRADRYTRWIRKVLGQA